MRNLPIAGRGRSGLLRRGFQLEYATLAWNGAGIVILAVAAITARSVALAGFGLDSLIEIVASAVVIWELSGTEKARRRRALRLIGIAFTVLAIYLLVQSSVVLVLGFHPSPSPAGIIWTGLTAVVMFALAAGKARTGAALGNPVLRTEAKSPSSTGSLPPPSCSGPSSTLSPTGGGPIPWLATCSSITALARPGASYAVST